MNHPRNDFLTNAGLSSDQHLRVGPCGRLNVGTQLLESRPAAKQHVAVYRVRNERVNSHSRHGIARSLRWPGLAILPVLKNAYLRRLCAILTKSGQTLL